MKKLLVCVAVAGVAVIYFLCKNKNEENRSSKSRKEKFESDSVNKEETSAEEQGVIKEMYTAKGKSAQSVGDRHTEVAGIMADAFANIMKEIEPVEFEEKSVDTVVDTKDTETFNKLDSLSDELDELAK